SIDEKKIGENIRDIRKRIGITLDDLAEKVGITKSTLSKIETGKTSTPINTMLRIANALEVDITEFFLKRRDRPPYVHTRKGLGQIVTRDGSRFGYTYEALALKMVDKLAEPFLLTIDKNDNTGDFQHAGEEFVYILSGTIIYTIGNDSITLNPGDSLYFNSGIVHSMRVLSDTPVKLLFVMITPSPRLR
ncbi:MAG: XRE family transcriptional regulator, partial [Spirochaetota bacterium]